MITTILESLKASSGVAIRINDCHNWIPVSANDIFKYSNDHIRREKGGDLFQITAPKHFSIEQQDQFDQKIKGALHAAGLEGAYVLENRLVDDSKPVYLKEILAEHGLTEAARILDTLG